MLSVLINIHLQAAGLMETSAPTIAHAARPPRHVPTPPRKDWGRLISYPCGRFIVELQRWFLPKEQDEL